ncbi:MAG: hypothetical protein LUG58_08965, partial [Clostridiales bacterium]|nr:hypothetical protein [Clostridiales bacterium]
MFKKIRSLLALLLACSLALACLPASTLAVELEELQPAVVDSGSDGEAESFEEEGADQEEPEMTSEAEENPSGEEEMNASSSLDEEADGAEELEEEAADDDESEETVETTWDEANDPTEIARLIRDSWSDDYFQEVVVDTRRNRVTMDGESAELSEVFDDVTEAEEDEIFSSVDAVEDYFADTAYETVTQSNGKVSVTAPYQT